MRCDKRRRTSRPSGTFWRTCDPASPVATVPRHGWLRTTSGRIALVSTRFGPLDAAPWHHGAVGRFPPSAACPTALRELVGKTAERTPAPIEKMARKKGRVISPAPRRWVMVGCLQGKTISGCRTKVNKTLIETNQRVTSWLDEPRHTAAGPLRPSGIRRKSVLSVGERSLEATPGIEPG